MPPRNSTLVGDKKWAWETELNFLKTLQRPLWNLEGLDGPVIGKRGKYKLVKKQVFKLGD